MLTPRITRFRGYQIDQAGSSFSYFADGKFTLIEGIATDVSKTSIKEEVAACGKERIDTLHITSWDSDHCSPNGLAWILENLKPSKIEFPGYAPHTDCAKDCKKLISDYHTKRTQDRLVSKIVSVDPPYISGLENAQGLGYTEMFYHPKVISEKSNDNSTVKFFRTGNFNVLSLGDIECANIGSYLRNCKILCAETDVMILAHHGSAGGVTTKKFLSHLNPSVAVCTSNYDNQYSHPDEEVIALLEDAGIPLYTTKTGDILVQSIAPHTNSYRVTNLCAGSTQVSSQRDFVSRKSGPLSGNRDAINNRYNPGFKGIRR